MSKIIVAVYTDHEDSDDAARSVLRGMKRAGYNEVSVHVWRGTDQLTVDTADALVVVCEPEVEVAGRAKVNQ